MSNATETATNLGRKFVNRAETVLGDDAREVVRRVKRVGQELRNDYRYDTGYRPKKKKPDPRKYYGRSSSR